MGAHRGPRQRQRYRPRRSIPTPGPRATAVVAPSPIALRTGGTDVAGPGAGPDTTLPPLYSQNQAYQTGIPGITIGGAASPLAPPGTTPASLAAPATTAATPPAPPAAATPPAAAQPPATGQNSPQFQAAMELNRRAQALDMVVDPTGRTKALAASLRAQAALYMQADSVVQTPQGQVHTLTGKIDDPAKPLANYQETSPGSGIWVGGPGTDPKFQPPGRLIVAPDGKVWQTGVGGAHVLADTDPNAVAALAAAKAQGTGVGGDVAKQLPALVAQGRDATQAIGQATSTTE